MTQEEDKLAATRLLAYVARPDCPSSEEIAKFAMGGENADNIAAHIAKCKNCYEETTVMTAAYLQVFGGLL
jgi:hypothetical protein